TVTTTGMQLEIVRLQTGDRYSDPARVWNYRFDDFELLTPALLGASVRPGSKFTIVWGQTWLSEDETGAHSLGTITFDGVGRSRSSWRDKWYIRGKLLEAGYGQLGSGIRKRKRQD